MPVVINDFIAAKFCASPATAVIFIKSLEFGLSSSSKARFARGCNLVNPPTVPSAKGISIENLNIFFSTLALVKLL